MPMTLNERVTTHKHQARQILQERAIDPVAIDALWARLDDAILFGLSPRKLHGIPMKLLKLRTNGLRQACNGLLVKANDNSAKGGTEVFVYGKDRKALFAQVASVLDSRNCSIHDAHVTVTRDGYVFDSMLILENDGSRISSESRIASIENAITAQLEKPGRSHENKRKLPRQMKQLDVPTGSFFNINVKPHLLS